MSTSVNDDQFDALLADCDEAVAAGDLERIEQLVREHPELADRLEHGRECIELLQQLRPSKDDAGAIRPGTKIGSYKLLQEIGEGGFGVVYMAEQQEPVQRKVALKVIKPGMDTREVIARFEAERQALALMEHPNIAHVFDAGATDRGRPYFVMELVKGVPITDFCDKNNFSTQQRLELFITVCHAVQHAHHKGIIHRDLKPSNVMITLHDGRPVPKIIDFGVSKAISQRLTEKTLFTRYGQMVGTPQYMSPEQAEMSGLDVDTRSDIYSLGVLLYELLTGTTPVDESRLRSSGYAEMVRIIREEEPPKPSARVSTNARVSTLDKDLTVVCQQRSSDPKRLGQLLRGDLDWIVMKSLDKDRNRRYETANSLAQDIQRHLDDEPVEAGPPSAAYQLRKFMRRNKAAATAVVTVGLALLLGTALAIAGLLYARHEQKLASAARFDEQNQRKRAEAKESEAALARHRAETNLYFQQISRAHREWLTNNLTQAEQLLEECDRVHRDWEWHYLKRLFHSEMRTLRGEGDYGGPVAFSPDGSMLASASWFDGNDTSGELTVWNAGTGDRLLELPLKSSPIRALAFSPDSRRLAATATVAGISVWDANTGRWVFSQTSCTYYSIAFSPSGEHLATGCVHGNVQVRDAETGEVVHRLTGLRDTVHGIGFSPDGKRIAATCHDGVMRVWSAVDWRLKHELKPAGNRDVAFSPDGRLLATCGFNTGYAGKVIIWDTGSEPEIVAEHNVHSGGVARLAFSPDGRSLALNGYDGVPVWSPLSGFQERILRAHERSSHAVAFGPHARRLATSGNGIVKLWDMTTPPQSIVRRLSPADIKSMAFGSEGKQLVLVGGMAGGPKTTIDVWAFQESGDRQRVHQITGTNDWYTHVAFSPDGSRFAVSGDKGRVDICDPSLGEIVRTIEAHTGIASDVTFSPDGERLVSGGDDGAVVAWEANTGERIMTFEGHSAAITSVAVSPTEDVVVSAGEDKTIRFWNATTGAELRAALHSEDVVTDVLFSLDGRLLAMADAGGSINIWQTSSLIDGNFVAFRSAKDAEQRLFRGAKGDSQRPITLRGHTGRIVEISFSPDNRRLASLSRDGTAKVWDVASGQEAITLDPWGLHETLASVAFSPDGHRLAAARKYDVTIWESESRRLANGESRAERERALAWHQVQAGAAETGKEQFATAFHLHQAAGLLRRLMTDFPEEPKYQEQLLRGASRLGLAYSGLGQTADAIEHFRIAIEQDSPAAATYNNFAWLLATCAEREMRDATQAVELAQKAIDLDWSKGTYRNTLGVALYRQGQWQKAIAALECSMARGNGGDCFDWFFLAMASWELGDQEAASYWYTRAAKWIQDKDPEDDMLRRIQAEAATLIDEVSPVKDVTDRRRWMRVISGCNRLIAEHSDLLWLSERRAYARASLGEWQDASADWEKVIEINTNAAKHAEFLLTAAGAALLAEDRQRYDELCAMQLEGRTPSSSHRKQYLIARICLWAKNSDADAADIVALSQAAVAAMPDAGWYHHTLGLAQYRAGDFAGSIESLQKSMDVDADWEAHVTNWLVLAMAHHRLGDVDEARRWLDKAETWIETTCGDRGIEDYYSHPLHVHDWIECHLLLREARSLFAKSPAVP